MKGSQMGSTDFQKILKDFQIECSNQVLDELATGAHRLTVTASTGVGCSFIMMSIADNLFRKLGERTVFVVGRETECKFLKQRVDQYNLSNEIQCYTPNELFHHQDLKHKYMFFKSINIDDKKQIRNRIDGKDYVTVYFSNIPIPFTATKAKPYSNDNITNNLSALYSLKDIEINTSPQEDFYGVVGYYKTITLLDATDIRYADQRERLYISRQQEKSVNLLESQHTSTEHIRNHAISRAKELQEEINRHTLSKGKLAESLIELSKQEITIKQCENKIREQEVMISYLKRLLSTIGLAPDKIDDEIKKIVQERHNLAAMLSCDDENTREVAEKKFQDIVANSINNIINSSLPNYNKKSVEDDLIIKFTGNVWNRLDNASKSFLVSAKCFYNSISQMEDYQSLDFSGVCLLVTKAVEVEAFNRFFVSYKTYLAKCYYSISKWPYSMQKKDSKGHATGEIMPDSEFTLGSVVSIAGYKRNFDHDNNIIGFSIKNKYEMTAFKKYAENVLLLPSYKRKSSEEIRKYLHFIEKVRVDYRNPAAHKNSLSIISANECLSYVVDVQKMLMKMINTMKI